MKQIKRGKLLSALLAAIMVCTLVAGCGSDNDGKKDTSGTGDGTGYSGEITMMHFSTSEESEGNGGSDGFRTMIEEWEAANSATTLNQNVLANDDYKTQIATLASADDLPDVFLLQGMNTKTWSEQGLVMDMTDIIKESPYYEDYNEAYFTPFTDGDKLYGLPALTGGTCTVVVYDKAAWKDAGYDKFPETWEEVKKADKYFKDNGYTDTIAFGNGSQWQINSTFLTAIGDRFTGPDWFRSIIDKEGAAFTDDEFVDALTFTKDIFGSGIFNEDFNAIGSEDAREYYISGDATAVICGNWDVSYIQATLQKEDEKLYENTGFAVLPQPEGAEASKNTQAIGLGYSVSFNSKLEEGEKLDACKDLAYKLTGPDFSVYVGEEYALQGLTKVEDLDLSGFDQFTQDFYDYSYVSTSPCEIYDSYVSSAVWEVLNTNLQTMLNDGIEPKKVAELTQKSYESNY